eukprot:CAMPEP_0179303280 /NCGR_PEP_ID=MMETSP0797-20121207/48498_1 /TAXON_ID=47934 /ORGANISM="Dinophysis acuminata, Strain DAEP01" /LENGTH=65 /DNA_ID=CAMNT_0021012835 /DNA_START=25 /DNA_END=225 /DNA_ORIENTATION=+
MKYDAYIMSAAIKFGTCPSQFGTVSYASICTCDRVMAIPTAICVSCRIVTMSAQRGGFLQTQARK